MAKKEHDPVLIEDNKNAIDVTVPDFCLKKTMDFAFAFIGGRYGTLCVPATPDQIFMRKLDDRTVAVAWEFYDYGEPVPKNWLRVPCKEDTKHLAEYFIERLFRLTHKELMENADDVYVKAFRIMDIPSFREKYPEIMSGEITGEEENENESLADNVQKLASFIVRAEILYDT